MFHQRSFAIENKLDIQQEGNRLRQPMNFNVARWLFALCLTVMAEALLKDGFIRSVLKPIPVAARSALPFLSTSVIAPVVIASAPAVTFASDLATSLPVSLEVTNAAYLAVLLGTFVPVTFLIVLYSQSEARKAGMRAAKD